MIPRTPTAKMVSAAKAAVSGYLRDAAIIALWTAMWDAASVDRSPEGQDGETRLDAKHESAGPKDDAHE